MTTDDRSYAFADLMDKLFAGFIAQHKLPSFRESFTKQREQERVERANEFRAFDIVRDVLSSEIAPTRLSLDFALRHSSVLLDKKVSKSICRFYLSYMKSKKKYITVYGKSGKHEKIFIENVEDIYSYVDRLKEALTLRISLQDAKV